MLRSLNLKFSGNAFKWVHFNPNPFGNIYFKIWHDIKIEELIFDISEINFVSELFLVFFSGFENLQNKLISLTLNLFNSSAKTMEIYEIL